MSRCNPTYTSNAIWMSKSEQAAFTRALVEASTKPLLPSERETLRLFHNQWFGGRDMFVNAPTYVFFIGLCRSHGIRIRCTRKPKSSKGETGKSVEYAWTKPQENGSHWPTGKMTWAEKNQTKAKHRVRVMHEYMRELEIRTLDLGPATVAIEPAPTTPSNVIAFPVPNRKGPLDYADAYTWLPMVAVRVAA
jgi:hypothetical protein